MSINKKKMTGTATAGFGALLAAMFITPVGAYAAPQPFVDDVYQTYNPSSCSGPCSGAPIAEYDYVEVFDNSSISVDVLSNDSDNTLLPGDIYYDQPELRTLKLVGVGNFSSYSIEEDGWNIDTTYGVTGHFDPDTGQVYFNIPKLVDAASAYIQFEYVVEDMEGDRSAGYAVIIVSPGFPEVTLVDDEFTTDYNSPITANVLANDTIDGDGTMELISVEDTPHGTLSIVDGEIVYTPDDKWVGTEETSYTVRATVDEPIVIHRTAITPMAAASGERIFTANVSFTTNPPAAPLAQNDTLDVAYEAKDQIAPVLENDIILEEIDVEITSVTCEEGTATTDGTVISYSAPNGYSGNDTCDYVIEDEFGQTGTAVLNVQIAENDEEEVPPVDKPDDNEPPVDKPDDNEPPVDKPDDNEPPVDKPNDPVIDDPETETPTDKVPEVDTPDVTDPDVDNPDTDTPPVTDVVITTDEPDDPDLAETGYNPIVTLLGSLSLVAGTLALIFRKRIV